MGGGYISPSMYVIVDISNRILGTVNLVNSGYELVTQGIFYNVPISVL